MRLNTFLRFSVCFLSTSVMLPKLALASDLSQNNAIEASNLNDFILFENYLIQQRDDKIAEFAKCVTKEVDLEPIVYIQCAAAIISAAGPCGKGNTIGCLLKLPKVVKQCYLPTSKTLKAFVTCGKLQNLPPQQELKTLLPELENDDDLIY